MRLLVQALVAVLAASPPALGTPAGPGSGPRAAATLDVPYLPQTAALCGGASAAMVERYWGARGAQPEDFAALVDRTRSGIATGTLVRALAADGWAPYAFAGSLSALRHHLGAGRPVIALLQVAAARLHYVVVVGMRDGAVVFHDPALLPDRVEAVRDFEGRWAPTGHWMLVLLPGTGPRAPAAPGPPPAHQADVTAPRQPPPPCARLLEEGVALARDGHVAGARQRLALAATRCPSSPEPLVELASLDLLNGNYARGSATAREALSRDQENAHAWRVLATAQFLLNHRLDALDAWNRTGSPEVDLVKIDGLDRTRYGAVERFVGLAPGSLLTPGALRRARRRLEEFPALTASRLDFTPTGDDYTNLDAGVVERRLVPGAPLEVVALAARAASEREIRWTAGSPTRNGETITAAWRWWPSRRAVSLDARVPLAGALHGVLGLAGVVADESYVGEPGSTRLFERRRSAVASLGDWASSSVRWTVGARVDRWDSAGTRAGLSGGLEIDPSGDRVKLGMSGTLWPSGGSFGDLALDARWRSTTDPSRPALEVAAGAALATGGAPRDLWPGAGTGHARQALLRAHPLLDGRGVIAGPAFGRQLVHATAEGTAPVASALLARVQAAVFLDVAEAWRGAAPSRALADVGVGLRVRLAGEGIFRLDVAHGVADGANAMSIGWEPPWGRSIH